MSDRFVESFVEKLILLESKTGAVVHHRIMPPITTRFHDILSIQNTAKDIANFIGLTGFTFIVTVARQNPKVGGHIDLSTRDKEVFVEIDSAIMKFPDTVAATLCHEICHKWLQINGIRSPVTIENKILTDITTVFLGFGKIMLNGCRTTNVKVQLTQGGSRRITESIRVGYLDRDQLAFVYALVFAMRMISPPNARDGLNTEAANAVTICNSLFGHYYAPRFHQLDSVRDRVEGFTNTLTQAQSIMAGLDKHTTYVRKSFFDTVATFLKDGHNELDSLRQKAVAMPQDSSPDPALRFLQAIQIECELNRLRAQVDSTAQEAEAILRHAREIGHTSPETATVSRFRPPRCSIS